MEANEKYIHYVDLDKDFVAVFGEDADKSNKNLWKTFIPHLKFNETLTKLLSSLGRETTDPKSLWVVGAYGAGKTHAAFVVKHILSDELAEVEDYINKYEMSSILKKKLLALRRNEKILVVYKSGSSEITSARKLLLEIQYRIQKEIQRTIQNSEKQVTLVTKTEIELLREKLQDKVINWEEFIKRHNLNELGISTSDDLLARLNEEPIDIAFVEYILEALEEDGITVFKFSLENFKNWIDEIIKKGIFSRVVFIWDEFSDFFNQDNPPLTTLQGLAELTKSLPFYLVLITHRHPEQFRNVLKEDVQKLQARFNFIHYHMEPVTIYRLMSNVLRPRNMKEWKEKVQHLWTFLTTNYSLEDEIRKLLGEEENAKIEDMQRLFPLHPYAVYLSARIAQWFGSNQRTLFRFLKSDEDSEEIISFKRFLKKYPKDGWYLLTSDFLWEYFFVSDEKIQIFYPEVLGVINYWNTWRDKLSKDELKVFNVVMLITALGKKIELVSPLMKTTITTLKIAFGGTPLYTKLQGILDSLVDKGALGEVGGEYILPTYEVGDISKIPEPSFDSFVKENELINEKVKEIVTRGKNRLKVRLNGNKIPVVSIEDVMRRRIPTLSLEPYQLGVVFVVMKDQVPLGKVEETLSNISENYPNIIFVASSSELGEKNWKDIIRYYKYQKANEQSNRQKEATFFKNTINSKISSWLNEIEQGRFLVISVIQTDDFLQQIKEDRVYSSQALTEVLENIVRQTFRYGFDRLLRNDNLWRLLKSPTEPIKLALEHFTKVKKKGLYKEIYKLLVEEWEIIDPYGNIILEECESKQDLPLCVMKKKINTLFGKDKEYVSLMTLWNEMKKPPFGLYPSPLGAMIFAILLKEFSEGYYYTDGTLYGELNAVNLTTYINETISGKKEWFILKLSPEQKEFCKLLEEFFNLKPEEAKYPKRAIIATRIKITQQYKYPIWAVKYSTDLSEGETSLIDILNAAIKGVPQYNIETPLPKDIEELIREIVRVFDKKESGIEAEFLKFNIKGILNKPENFSKGFFNFVLNNISEEWLKHELAGKNIMDKEYLFGKIDEKTRLLLQEEPWAWSEEKVKVALEIIESDTRLTRELSQVFGISDVLFIDELLREIKQRIEKQEYIPIWMYKYHPTVTDESLGVFLALDKMMKDYESDPAKIRSEFNFEFLADKVSQTKDTIKKVITDRRGALQGWVSSKFSEQIGPDSLDSILSEIYRLIETQGTSVEENILSLHIQRVLDKLKITRIRKEILNELNSIFGTSDIRSFIRSQVLPIELIKYLPECGENKVARDIEDLFRSLLEINTISSEEKLKKIAERLQKYKSILQSLTLHEASYRAFKNFFGEEWLESILSPEDFIEFREVLMENLGKNIEFWNSKQIRDSYREWIKQKYQKEVYAKIQRAIESLSPEELKILVATIIRDEPEVGLKLAKLIGSTRG